MILVPFFASSTVYGSTKNLLSLPFQAPVFFGLFHTIRLSILTDFSTQYVYSKNTGAWKGRLKRFFVDPYAVELAKIGTNII